MCVTLNEGYLRAANRGSKTYADFKSKYNIAAFNEKVNFFGLFFSVFLNCRSTKLLRLFSGKLPVMFLNCFSKGLRNWFLKKNSVFEAFFTCVKMTFVYSNCLSSDNNMIHVFSNCACLRLSESLK